jgi:hypothetical protein
MRRGAQSVQTAVPKRVAKIPSRPECNHLAIHLHVNGRAVLAGNRSRPVGGALEHVPHGLGEFRLWLEDNLRVGFGAAHDGFIAAFAIRE